MTDQEDVDGMLVMWNNLEDLTITGLYVLRDVIENSIAKRTKDTDYQVRCPLPGDPACKLCWSCQIWINPEERFVKIQETGKTYHKECKP